MRAALVNLHPTLVIPPIPEKHTMADYAAKPTKAKEDVGIIDQRKRMLAVFLNRCRRMKEVVEDGVWWRFLDPNSSWVFCICSTMETCQRLTLNRTKSYMLTQSYQYPRTTSRPLRWLLQIPRLHTIGFLYLLRLPNSDQEDQHRVAVRPFLPQIRPIHHPLHTRYRDPRSLAVSQSLPTS